MNCQTHLTPHECARLIGFPDSLQRPVSYTQAYRQCRNSVFMLVMQEVARIMRPRVGSDRDGNSIALPLFP
ncbi:DNA cytosine methyltransferase [Candidatus Williamhamiltonella defendens]|uniref:DNA cytosine methyltransferase n=1 Tax=Candidatus Williamhamiltonella defendens TaxID=138072 RepID=UPI001C9DE835